MSARQDNKEYYPPGSEYDESIGAAAHEKFSGSHIILGVRDWEKKGYKKIVPQFYADQLAERLVELGFPGYISCDECEVFVTHRAMKLGLTERPHRIIYQREMYWNCPNPDCEYPTNKVGSKRCLICDTPQPPISSSASENTIINMMIDALCPKGDNCPLQINEGDRLNYIDLSVMDKDLIEKVAPIKDFTRKYAEITGEYPFLNY